MPQFIIERSITSHNDMNKEALCQISAKSNAIVARIGEPYTWITSYVTADKIYCIHKAESAASVSRHAQEGGFPADRVTEIKTLIGPHWGRPMSASNLPDLALPDGRSQAPIAYEATLTLRLIVVTIMAPILRFVAWKRQRDMEALLYAMPDHILKDIGISRGDISFLSSRPQHRM